MTKIKQMLCALLTVCLLLLGSTNAMAAQPDTPSISVSANASIEVAPDTAVISFDVNGNGRTRYRHQGKNNRLYRQQQRAHQAQGYQQAWSGN